MVEIKNYTLTPILTGMPCICDREAMLAGQQKDPSEATGEAGLKGV